VIGVIIKKIYIYLIIFFISFVAAKAQEKIPQSVTNSDIYYPGWTIKKPEQKISKVYLVFNKELVKKYDKPNWIITCLDKKSDLYKKGIKLYDEILEINGSNPSLYKYSSDPFTIKIKRENQIITLQKINPVIWGKEDFVCSPESSEIICLKEFVTNTKSLEEDRVSKLWYKVFECCEKNNTFILPFLEEYEDHFLKLDQLSSIVLDLQKQKKYLELSRYIKIAEKDLKKIEAVAVKFPDYKLPNSYRQLSLAISQSNLYNQDFKDDQKTEYDFNENASRVKKIVDNQIQEDTKNLKTLKLVQSNLFYLKQEKQYDYLQRILSKLIADNYAENSDEYVSVIGEFYEYLAWIYAEQYNGRSFIKIHDDANNWLKLKKPSTLQTRIINKRLINNKMTFFFSVNQDYLNTFIKSDWKIVDDYLNEFYLLTTEDQNKILEIDPRYLYDGYVAISRFDNIFNFSGKGLSYYTSKALEEIRLRPKIGDYNKIYNYGDLLIGADVFKDDILVNKTLLDIKNFFIEAKGKDQHLVAIKGSFASLYSFYTHRGLFSELNELISFYDSLFAVKVSDNPTATELGAIYYYYSAKSYIERNKNNYEKSLEYLEKIINIPYFNISSIIYDYNYNKGKIEVLKLLVLQNTLPDLYDGYYQANKIEKIKEITKLGLNVEIDNINYENLKPILLVSNPMRIFNPLIAYYAQNNNKEKLKIISSFIYDNFEQITKENTLGQSLKTPNDFTYSTAELIKNNEKKLAYNLYEKANLLVSKKYNDILFNSIWRYSNSDIDSAVQILEGVNLLETEDFFDKAFNTAQIIKNSNTARDILKGYLSKKNQTNSDISEYHNLQKDLISLTKMEESVLSRSSNQSLLLQNKFNKDFGIKKNRLDELETKIKKTNPEYFESIKFEGVKLKNIQSKLKKNQAVLDYYFSKDKLAIIIIKKDSYKVHIERVKIADLNILKNNIRNTLQVSKNGNLVPFDLKSAFKLNQIVFLNLEKYLNNVNYLFISPNGPLNEIPLHALPKNNGSSCYDCSSVEWNLSSYTFNYLTSLDSFQVSENNDFFSKILKENFNKFYNEFENNQNLKKVKDDTIENFANIFKSKNDNKKEIIKNDLKIKYLGIGDPDLYVRKQNSIENININRFVALRSVNLSSNTRSINVGDLYLPLKGSKEEILFAAKIFGEENSTVWLRENATETKIKEADLSKFNIIHFATHAEVSGMNGLNEPFLVLSSPKEKTDKDNGLLMMNEIMQLNLNADLVILSACNTASVEDQYSGSYSGLAKAFFVAGAKSVLVSNWFVEDTATQKLIKKFMENISKNEVNFSENLNLTMKELSKQKNQGSHPIFWAPFVFVGTDKEIIKNLN
jgi:CHAT domain-containing protein